MFNMEFCNWIINQKGFDSQQNYDFLMQYEYKLQEVKEILNYADNLGKPANTSQNNVSSPDAQNTNSSSSHTVLPGQMFKILLSGLKSLLVQEERWLL